MTDPNLERTPKLYPQRYVIVILAFLSIVLSSFHWTEYISLADRMRPHYNVSDLNIDLTAMVYGIAYIILVRPVTAFITSFGIKAAFVLGAFANVMGFCIKCMAVKPNGFYLALGGQTLAGIGQIFLLGAAPMVTGAWFPVKQAATINTLLYAGNYVGSALGFLVEGVLFNKGSNTENSLESLSIFLAVVSTVVYLPTVFAFSEKPPTPPSLSQEIRETEKDIPLKRLLTGRDFVAYVIIATLVNNVYSTLLIVLNPLILAMFNDNQTVVAVTGVLMLVPGIFSSPAYGMILDSTKAFRLFTNITYFLCIASTFMLLGALWFQSQYFLYAAATAFGWCLAGFNNVAVDVVIELTFPAPEAISVGLFLFTTNVTCLSLNVVSAKLLTIFGPVALALVFACLLLLGLPCMWIMTWDLKRQRAEKVKAHCTNGSYVRVD